MNTSADVALVQELREAARRLTEPGAIEAVARLASAWFRHFLVDQLRANPEGADAR
jgi:hypothetical protein